MNHGTNRLANPDVRTIGHFEYRFEWSGGQGTPPVYELRISRNMSGSSVEGVMNISVTGVNAHCFEENRGYRECIVDALAKQFEAVPPDDMEAQ